MSLSLINKNALIYVFDKKNLHILIPFLERNYYNIYTSQDTLHIINRYINNKSILFSLSNYTKYPEICDGIVKTLHPHIYAGILGSRDNLSHKNDINNIRAKFFDLVVVNLCPFEKLLQQNLSENTILDNIDIERHSLLRAASKNYKHISILSSPEQYHKFINNKLTNLYLAKSAFTLAMQYDIAINNWINNDEIIGTTYHKIKPIKYGLNPYMKPSYIYSKNNEKIPFTILNGNPEYIHLLNAHYAIHLVLEVNKQLGVNCCVSYKHNSPTGVATTTTLHNNNYISFFEARNIDPKSSIGDFIGYSGTVNSEMANILKMYITEGIIATDYTFEALEILKNNKNDAYVILQQTELPIRMEYRDVNGATLIQPSNTSVLNKDKILHINDNNIKNDIILGYITLKYTQSKSICFVYKGKVIGISSGQQNINDAINIAGKKATQWFKSNYDIDIWNSKQIIMISDSIISFTDNIETATNYNVKYVVQPGGSKHDKEILEESKKYNIVMIFTNLRQFTH